MPRLARAESADPTLEDRLDRLEKMVESLIARGYATQNQYPSKPSPDQDGLIIRKHIAEIEAHARHQAEMARHHELDVKEIEKIKEHARHEAARAASQVKRAVDAEKIARADQKRQTRRVFKEGSHKELDDLRKQLEILEREREKLERQIEELERNEEQLDHQENEDQDNDVQSNTSESNPDSTPNPRQ